MIIDARTAKETKHGRPLTLSAAVANFLDEVKVGDQVDITGFINSHGAPVSRAQLDTLVFKHKGCRVFSVRQSKADGVFATVVRLK